MNFVDMLINRGRLVSKDFAILQANSPEIKYNIDSARRWAIGAVRSSPIIHGNIGCQDWISTFRRARKLNRNSSLRILNKYQ